MFEDIKNRFAETASHYEAIKDHTERLVVRWRYSMGQLWDYQPVWQGVTRAYITTEETNDLDEAKFAYGYDIEDRVVCTRHYDTVYTYKHYPDRGPDKTPHRELRLEYFIGYQEEFMEVFRFVSPRNSWQSEHVERKLQFVDRLWFTNGKVSEFEHFDTDSSYSHNLYAWEGEMMRRSSALDSRGRVYMEFDYDDLGANRVFIVRKDGSRYIHGESRPKEIGYKQLFEMVRQRLVKAVPKVVQEAAIGEPIYCVALAYHGGSEEPLLPPVLGVGLESERQRWLVNKGSEAGRSIWNPAEFYHCFKPHTEFDNDDLEEASGWLNDELEERGTPEAAIRLMVEAAIELEKLDWSSIVPTTEDFIVYVTDFQLNDLDKHLKKILPTKKLAALRAAKLL